ncbi:MAG: iron-containing alcohol dehydrogenase [Spirochaetota bacterium]
MRPPINTYIRSITSCTCGERHDITTKDVLIGKGVIHHIATLFGPDMGGRPLILADMNTHAVAGKHVRELCAHASMHIEELVLPGEVHADAHNLNIIAEGLTAHKATVAVAVGSGTINDLVKVAANDHDIPYLCVATAASMDGYLSANATILTNGNKVPYSTIRPPIAVIADTDIIRAAPERMTLAGLGDALGKITSIADWKLNHLLREEPFCLDTASMLREEVADMLSYLAQAQSLSDDEFIQKLMRILVLTGTAMQRMGNSAPASGGEHCISHAMEMKGYACMGQAPSLHGLQVAYGLGKSLAAYCDLFDPEHAYDFARTDVPAALRGHVSDWKNIGIDLQGTIEKKAGLLARFRSSFSEIRNLADDDDFRFLLSAAPAVRMVAEEFSLPMRCADIDLMPEDARFAVLHAVDIRPRFTIFDLHFAADTIEAYASA